MCYAPLRFSFLCCFLRSTPGRLARGPLHSQTVYRPAQPQRVAVVGLVKLLHPPDALRQDGQRLTLGLLFREIPEEAARDIERYIQDIKAVLGEGSAQQ